MLGVVRFAFRSLFVSGGILLAISADAACPRVQGSGASLTVTIEGLCGVLCFGSPARRSAQSMGATTMAFSHTAGADRIARCVEEYARNNPGAKVSLMGHSLGGGVAQRTAQALGTRGIGIENLIVFDGRQGNEFRCGSAAGAKYSKPANVKQVLNFYQCGFMPGNTYAEGPGVKNINVRNMHVAIPNDPGVKNAIRDAVASAPAMADAQIPLPRAPSAMPGRLSRSQAALGQRSKDNQPAICLRGGARYLCTYREASQLNSDEGRH